MAGSSDAYRVSGFAGRIEFNAVYHATGKRVRDLPITLNKSL